MSPILSRLSWAQGFGRRPFVPSGSAIFNNIEDFFSTYLYYGATATVSHMQIAPAGGGTPTVSTDSPFTGEGEGYNSVEFDLNKCIEVTGNSRFDFGSNVDFTVEWWEKRFPLGGNAGNIEKDPYMTIMDIGNTSAGLYIGLNGQNTGTYWVKIGNGNSSTILTEGTGVAAASGWHHYAFTVEGLGGNQQKARFYRDGVEQANNTVNSITWGSSTDSWTVGGQKAYPGNYNFQGRVSNFRVTKGICRYKANFSVPTKPFDDWADGINLSTLFVCCKSAGVLGADGDIFTNSAYTKKTRVKYLEKGGLVWIKCRSGGQAPALIDTIRGRDKFLMTDSTSGQTTDHGNISAFTGDGFSVGNDSRVNNSGDFYASWSFARDPKFMDIVEYTGDGATSRYIDHTLDNIPGFIMIKNLDQGNTGWVAIHRNSESGVSDPGQAIHQMNVPYSKVWDLGDTPDAQYPSLGGPDNRTNQFHVTSNWNNYEVSGGAGYMGTNNNGEKYIAYIFAHDESADGMIRCGYFNTSGNGISPVDENKTSYNDLGWEPQWILTKEVCEDTTNYPATSGNWLIWDDKRGVGKYYRIIEVDSSNTESGGGGSTDEMRFYPRGFRCENFAAGRRFIYIAIRKGLMGNPEDTERKAIDLFSLTRGGTSSSTYDSNNGGFSTRWDTGALGSSYGFAPDAGFLLADSTGSSGPRETFARVVGTSSRGGGAGGNVYQQSWDLDGNDPGNNTSANKWPMFGGNVGGNNLASGANVIWTWRRAKGFFDTAYFYSNGNANQPYPHNLGVVPEMIWQRRLNNSQNGMYVYHKDIPDTQYLETSAQSIATSSGVWGDGTVPHTKTHFTMGNIAASNQENIAFLFATCPGLSKVGKYDTLANGDPQNIDCGFTTGARAIILKRMTNAQSSDGWFCFDTERGLATSYPSSGSTTWVASNGDALKIQGPDNGGGNGLQFGTGAFTIECWIKTTAQAGWIMNNCFVSNGFAISVGNQAVQGSGYDGRIEFAERMSGSVHAHTFSSGTINDGNWHHIAMSRPANTSATYCFVDGSLQGSHGGGVLNHSSPEDCFFGRMYSGGGNTFDGQISNVRITNTHLYSSNFTVPTSPLPQTGGTKLLFLQSSTNPLEATVTPGTVSYTGSALSATGDNPFSSAVTPYMRLDDTQPQTTTPTPWVKKTNEGFRIESGNDINVANETYIYYAIA